MYSFLVLSFKRMKRLGRGSVSEEICFTYINIAVQLFYTPLSEIIFSYKLNSVSCPTDCEVRKYNNRIYK